MRQDGKMRGQITRRTFKSCINFISPEQDIGVDSLNFVSREVDYGHTRSMRNPLFSATSELSSRHVAMFSVCDFIIKLW